MASADFSFSRVCQAIPKLNASTNNMMRCVDALVQKGGTDLAANHPNAAFREWCEADLTRAHEVIRAAKKDDPLANKFLTFALIAGTMAEEAEGFVKRFVGQRQLSAIAALGRMKHESLASACSALSVLAAALDKEPDDLRCGNVLIAALEIAEKHREIPRDTLVPIVKRA
jgi:hypothetical protein